MRRPKIVLLQHYAPQFKDAKSRVEMVGTQHSLVDLQGTLGRRSGQVKVTQEAQHLGHLVERDSYLGVLRSMDRFHHRHEALKQGSGLGVLAFEAQVSA